MKAGIPASQVAIHDLDSDGVCELIVRDADGTVDIFWGGPDGVDNERVLPLPVPPDPPQAYTGNEDLREYEEYIARSPVLVKVLPLPAGPDRTIKPTGRDTALAKMATWSSASPSESSNCRLACERKTRTTARSPRIVGNVATRRSGASSSQREDGEKRKLPSCGMSTR